MRWFHGFSTVLIPSNIIPQTSDIRHGRVRGPYLKLALCPHSLAVTSQLYLDHSHCLVLAPATLAALPSTRAIETRSLPSSLAATHRGFTFYVAFPKAPFPQSRRVLCRSSPFAPF